MQAQSKRTKPYLEVSILAAQMLNYALISSWETVTTISALEGAMGWEMPAAHQERQFCYWLFNVLDNNLEYVQPRQGMF